MPELKTARVVYFDWLNVAACFSVVVLHATGDVFNFSNSGTWFVAIMLQAVCHFSIPVFFMLAGATLMDYRQRYSTREFFQHRLKRLGIPFLFWTVFYIFWNTCIMGAPLPSSPLEIVNIFLQNKASNIFWFFYALIPVYLLIPIFSLIDWKKHRRILCYILIICLLYNQIFPLITRFSGLSLVSYADFPLKFSYFDYVFLGYFLKDLKLTRGRFWVILIIGIVGFIGMVGGTWIISNGSGQTDSSFMDYHSLFCYMMAVAVFTLARFFAEKRAHIKGQKLFRSLSGISFGVYLMHLVTLTILTRYMSFQHPIISMVVTPVLAYVITCGAALGLKKIPVVRRIIA